MSKPQQYLKFLRLQQRGKIFSVNLNLRFYPIECKIEISSSLDLINQRFCFYVVFYT